MKIGTKVAVVGLPTYVAGILYAEQMALVNGTVCTVISAERQEFFGTKFAPAHDVEDASGNQWCINSIHLIPLDETECSETESSHCGLTVELSRARDPTYIINRS